MGGSIKSIHYAIRVTPQVNELGDIIDSFEPLLIFDMNLITFAAWVQELSAKHKTHFHYAVTFIEPLTNNQVNSMLTKRGVPMGNGGRSVKRWNGDNEYLQYMSKDGLITLFGTRLNLLTPDQYREEYERYIQLNANKAKKLLPSITEIVINDPTIFESITKMNNKYDFYVKQEGYEDILQLIKRRYIEYHFENSINLKQKFFRKTDYDNILLTIVNDKCDSLMEMIIRNE